MTLPSNGNSTTRQFETRRCPTPKANSDLFRCPICNGQFVEPVVVNACSHRFCFRCLSENVKADRRCPTCFVQLDSTPAFTIDQAFGLAIKMINRLKPVDAPYKPKQNFTTVEKKNGKTEVENINIVLCPHSSVYELDLPRSATKTRFLQVPDNTSVEHLVEFLFLRIAIEDQQELKKTFRIEVAHYSETLRPTTNSLSESHQLKSTTAEFSAPLKFETDLSKILHDLLAGTPWPLKLNFRFVPLTNQFDSINGT